MAMTIQQQTDAYRFFAIAFGAAPGVTYMNQIADAYAAGMTTKQIVNVYTTKPQFTSVYPNFYTNAQFANALIENVVGTSASAAAKAQAKADVEAALNIGWTRGDVIYQIFTNLANKPLTDPDWGNTAKLLANQVAVARYYTEVKLGDTTDLAVLKSVIAGVTPTTDVSTPAALDAVLAGVATGQTFTLTTGLDNVPGTSGNDTINGTHSTLTLGDVIDGGNGNDTLYIGDTGTGANFNLATIKNVENLIYQAATGAASTLNLAGLSGLQSVTYQDLNSTAQNVTINTKGNATSVTVKNAASVTVSDAATTDTLASVSIDGNSGAATITSDALTSLSLANTNQNATVTAAAGTRTLNVTVNNVTGGAAIQDNTATAVAITGSSKASSIGLTAAAATSLSFAGDAAVTLTAAPGSVTGITSTNTAGVTITTALGTGVSFTGGDGKDKVEVGATTKTIDMGKGDDTVVITTGVTALGSGGSLKGGDGTDTISMDADDAATATASSTFANSIDGFERLDISGAAGAAVSVNLANLDNIADVRVSANIGQNLTLDNLATNGTVTWTTGQTAGTSTTINVAGAASNSSDIINLAISNTASISAQTVTVANVETVNLNTDDSAATPSGTIAHTLTLDAANAKTLNVTGDAGVTLTLSAGSTALETINTSGVTKGAVSVTTVGTGSVTLTGGDTNTTFNASTVGATKSATIVTGAGNDTITGGAGDDTINAGNGTNSITGGSGKDIMTGGTGVDTYVYTAATDSQGTKVDVITNFQVGAGGDVIDVSAISGTAGQFLGIANGYGAVLTALVNNNKTNAVFDSSTSTLYIDVDGDAALTSADMAIQLTGVTSGLVAGNFVL
ncbi:hypothetical protein EDC62_0845 [Tibeticola sediminis]|uniref:Hemolysin type calcium-binding protein n=1 Tax=Tibeticola sediminis TaxID=1917811 RepID=A0A3N4VJJ7_9BURK|nr:calcium-binding protein [Tibeticola sediminis]RPE73134.1 hypothetical protein EDC62_0845 [Tibeticola sediminis]